MKEKNYFTLIIFLILSLSITYYSCENTTDTDPVYKGMILGWVYDDSTRLPISAVKVWADGIPDTLYTNDSGRFQYTKISMPRGEFTYSLIFQKIGYIDKSYTIFCKSYIESRIDSLFMKKPLYTTKIY